MSDLEKNPVHKLPVLALRNTVLFPGVTVPLGVGRPATIAAVQAALANDDKRIFAVAERDEQEGVQADNLYLMGTVARIVRVDHGPRSLRVIVQGEERGAALRYETQGQHLLASVTRVADADPVNPKDPALLALERELRERAVELAEQAGLASNLVVQALESVSDLGQLADLVASYLDLEPETKQEILQTPGVEERLRSVLVHVQRQLNVLEAQEDIKSQVEQELGDRQREMVLREQMKAIQKELGEGGPGEELEELAAKIGELDLPKDVRKNVDRDLQRLLGLGAESMEAQVLRTYLETVAELPWSERSDERIDLTEATEILGQDHYGLQEVKDRVLEHLAVLALGKSKATAKKEDQETPRAPILLFTGPPGVGKTSIAKSIARATGREYVRVSLGGARDEADIRGHRRTYVGAMPGRIVQGLRQAGTKNPVFLLDEIDKLGASYQGNPASALLEVLDPAQNDSFVDHYLGIPFDLSEVLFVATANYVQNIPAPLLDRMEIVEFSGYTEAEKLEIARRYLLPRQLRANAVAGHDIVVPDSALARVITYYTREAGVRQLEKQLGKLSRKIARRVATDAPEHIEVDEDRITEYLGKPRARPEHANAEDRVGVSTGMFYTPMGGDIMFIETTTMKGRGNLELTGQLGDVMRESARAVWSYARSHAPEFLIEEDQFERDIHIHVPAGAIPKDGPSAGVALATSLVSALSGVPVRHNVAMTGEVTLTGRVLPIGGVKEKVLGAVRAGIDQVILPRENEPDLEDLPESTRQKVRFHLVDQLDEVLEIALTSGVFRQPIVTAS